MYFDILSRYCLAQAIAGTSAVPSTDIINHGASPSSMAEPMAVLCPVIVAQGGTGASLVVSFETATVDDFSDAVTVARTPSIAQATLVAGYHVNLPLPPFVSLSGYSRILFQQSGTAPTITVSGYVLPTSMVESLHLYPAAAGTSPS